LPETAWHVTLPVKTIRPTRSPKVNGLSCPVGFSRRTARGVEVEPEEMEDAW
jgi:hypothetical protein